MRYLKVVFLSTIAVLILAVTCVSAQTLSMPLDEKTVTAGTKYVRFDGVTYRIMTSGDYFMTFSRVDPDHHRVFVVPTEEESAPYCDILLQWNWFPAVELDLGAGGGGVFILGTETGYVEK